MFECRIVPVQGLRGRGIFPSKYFGICEWGIQGGWLARPTRAFWGESVVREVVGTRNMGKPSPHKNTTKTAALSDITNRQYNSSSHVSLTTVDTCFSPCGTARSTPVSFSPRESQSIDRAQGRRNAKYSRWKIFYIYRTASFVTVGNVFQRRNDCFCSQWKVKLAEYEFDIIWKTIWSGTFLW